MTAERNEGKQAAGRPGRNEGRAWIRERFPEPPKPKPNPWAKQPQTAKPPRRAVYVAELEGGGCLVLREDGSFQTLPKLSPPEGEGWAALHDEQGLEPGEKARNKKASKAERKLKAEGGERRRRRAEGLRANAEAKREGRAGRRDAGP